MKLLCNSQLLKYLQSKSSRIEKNIPLIRAVLAEGKSDGKRKGTTTLSLTRPDLKPRTVYVIQTNC